MSNLGIAQSNLTGAGGTGTSSAFTFRGAWSNVTAYATNDIVTRKGSSYLAVTGSTGVDPYTDTTSTNWSLITQGFNYAGTWLVGTSYNFFDVVTLNNSFYLSIVAGEQTNTGNNPQTDGGVHWSLLDQGFNFRGAYSAGTTYQSYDVVTFNSSTYVGLTTNNTGNQPDTHPANWSLMAAAGQVAPRQTLTFTMPSASISNIALTSNVVTVTTSAAHGFSTGNTVYLTGLTTATYLNGQVLTIASTPTTTTFTASFTHTNDTSHSDTGTVTLSIAVSGKYNTTIALGKTFALSKVQCAQATRIELYSTVASRTADSSRPATTQPTVGTQHGVITDLNLDGVNASFTSWVMSPLAYGANLEDGTVNIPAALTNLSGSPTTNTFSITFTFTYEEQ
jgi:hypothetical protein